MKILQRQKIEKNRESTKIWQKIVTYDLSQPEMIFLHL